LGELLGKAKCGSKDGYFIPGRSSLILHRDRKFHPTFTGLHPNAKNPSSVSVLFDVRDLNIRHGSPLRDFCWRGKFVVV
jgi:hypothetical protein